MFKHVLISLIIIVIIYFIVKGLNVFFHKIIVSKNISKYHMSENDMSLINTYSELFKNNTNQFIFYTTVPWNGITNNNYIYSKKNDTYYIIDTGFYYYIDNSDNYEIVFNSKKNNIKVFSNFKKVNLV